MSLSREIFGETLTECAAELFKSGFLTDEILEKLYVHASRLCDEGQKFNLTAITDTREVALKHFADSLAAAYIINKIINEDNEKVNNINIEDNEKINNINIKINNINEENTASKNAALSLLDVGSGAGFPALPIAAACPNVKVSSLDATAKKCGFIKETARLCKLDVEVFPERAEALARGELRGSFDFVTARAVARLNILAELCSPFLKVGGVFAAMKGPSADDEAKEAEPAAKKLSLELFEKYDYEAKGLGRRSILLYRKKAATSDKYPRPFSKIKKDPL